MSVLCIQSRTLDEIRPTIEGKRDGFQTQITQSDIESGSQTTRYNFCAASEQDVSSYTPTSVKGIGLAYP